MPHTLAGLFGKALSNAAIMIGASGAISFAIGLPLGLILAATDEGGIFPALVGDALARRLAHQ